VRTSYLFSVAAYETSNGGSSSFQGAGPDYGALLTYYQAAASSSPPSLQIIGPGDRVVRSISGTHDQDGKKVPNVPNSAGVNRIAWDLTSDAPAKWNSAPKWNRGPSSGPEAVPGIYTARLTLGGRDYSQTFEVKADPRSPWTEHDYIERRSYLTMLYGDYSTIDTDLNSLDAIQSQLADRRKAAGANSALVAKFDAVQASLVALRAQFTSNPQGDQDDDFLQDMVRERIESLMSSMSGSFQPPTAALVNEGTTVHSLFLRVDSDYHSFVNNDLGALNSALGSARLTVIKP
jgi:hypothetical protein